MPLHLDYTMSRGDFVALSIAVARRPLPVRLAWVAAMWMLVGGVMAMLPGGTAPGTTMFDDLLAGNRDWWPLLGSVAVLSVLALFRHRVAGLQAAGGYARTPLADHPMAIDLDETEVRVVAGEFDWSFPWEAVSRMVETSDRLVLVVGAREGLPLPRRAVATTADWEALRAFVTAHMPKGATHARA